MSFLKLNSSWSNLAPYYNQRFNNKPEIPFIRYTAFDDGLIRGGLINATLASVKDTARIGKFYLSGRGVSFLIKQVGLQLSNPQLEQLPPPSPLPTSGQGLIRNITNTVTNFATKNGPTRVYNLGLNTLTQVPLTAFGGHIIRHGLLPTGGGGFLEGDSLNNIKGYNYESIVLTNDKNGKNRLVSYLDKIKSVDASDTKPIELNSYNGGAASIYGIGKTFITTTNIHTNRSTESTLSYRGILTYFDEYKSKTSSGFISNQQAQAFNLIGQSISNLNRASFLNESITNPFTGEIESSPSSVDKIIADQLNRTAADQLNEAKAKQDLIDSVNNSTADLDFDIWGHPLYTTRNIQSRVGTSTSKFGPNNIKNTYKVDAINAINILDSTTFYDTLKAGGTNPNNSVTQDGVFNQDSKGKVAGYFGRDIARFVIEFLDNDSTSTDVLAFRAYLDNFDDGMSAKWNAYRYMGRGEEFYIYEGFTRDISVAFTIFAHSPEEMKPLYQKLNYLMSTFAPDYTPSGKMRGNIGYLTVGDYISRQPGVFTDIKLSGFLDSNWEINLDYKLGGEPNIKQNVVPKHLKVTLSFKPIHNVLPRKSKRNNPFLSNFILPGSGSKATNNYI